MWLVKLSDVPPITPVEVQARLAADMPIRITAERVRLSIGTDDLARAEEIYRRWSHRGDVRAGRTRVRLVPVADRTVAARYVTAECAVCGGQVEYVTDGPNPYWWRHLGLIGDPLHAARPREEVTDAPPPQA